MRAAEADRMSVMVLLALLLMPVFALLPVMPWLERARRIPPPVSRPAAGTALYCALRRNQARSALRSGPGPCG